MWVPLLLNVYNREKQLKCSYLSASFTYAFNYLFDWVKILSLLLQSKTTKTRHILIKTPCSECRTGWCHRVHWGERSRAAHLPRVPQSLSTKAEHLLSTHMKQWNCVIVYSHCFHLSIFLSSYDTRYLVRLVFFCCFWGFVYLFSFKRPFQPTANQMGVDSQVA